MARKREIKRTLFCDHSWRLTKIADSINGGYIAECVKCGSFSDEVEEIPDVTEEIPEEFFEEEEFDDERPEEHERYGGNPREWYG